MRQFFFFITLLATLGLLAGCGDPPPESFTPATITSKTLVEKSDIFAMELDIPVVEGLADETLQEKINQILEADAMGFTESLRQQSEVDYANFQAEGIPWAPYESASQWTLHLSNEKVLSMSVDYYSFTGGAHGLTTRSCYNYLLDDGVMLTLPTLFSQGSPWKERLNVYVRQAIAAKPDEYFPVESPEGMAPVTDELQFFLDEENLILNFGVYEIAPYASGMPNITIPVKEIEDILIVQW
jgi:predicted small lipoprotein YifL